MNTSLRELQKWMRWVITDPRGVDAALLEPKPTFQHPVIQRFSEPGTSKLEMIDGRGAITRNERLSIYAEAYFARLLEILSDDFKLSQKIIGEDKFRDFAITYFTVYPSQTTTVAEIGRNVPRAIQSHGLSNEYPWLKDAADLEWLMIESFYSPVLEAMDPADLANKSEDQWAAAKFTLDPSLRIRDYAYPVDILWNLNHAGEELTPILAEPVSVMVLRGNGECSVTRISEEQKNILSAMANGKTLSEILAVAGEGAGTVMNELSQWLTLGVIKSIVF